MGAIYTVTTNANVAADGTIPIGGIVRRVGNGMSLSGSSITCCGRGYYRVSVSATVTPDAAGVVGIQLYQDGSPVPGALASGTGVLNSPLGLAFTAMVRQGCGATSLSVALDSDGTGTAAVIENCAICVERV